MPTVGLAMIVKNEERIITNALDSAAPLIDYALICDTGSTDNTSTIVSDWFRRTGIPGKVISEPWRDFGHNRSHVLAQYRDIPGVDYVLMLDADDAIKLTGDPGAIKQQLTADCYQIPLHHGALVYSQPRLTSNRLPFYYRGPAHEWLDCGARFTKADIDGIVMLIGVGDGARKGDPLRYRREAEAFAEQLKRDDLEGIERPRYTFYLAQSWRDCGELEKALQAYRDRVELGGWREEVYVSLLNIARLQARLSRPLDDIIETYKKAIAFIPERAEAIYGLTRAFRMADLHNEAYAVGERGIRLPLHKGLFVEEWIYRYGLLDEFSIAAYYSGHKTVSWLAFEALRGNPDLDEATRKRIITNAAFARR